MTALLRVILLGEFFLFNLNLRADTSREITINHQFDYGGSHDQRVGELRKLESACERLVEKKENDLISEYAARLQSLEPKLIADSKEPECEVTPEVYGPGRARYHAMGRPISRIVSNGIKDSFNYTGTKRYCRIECNGFILTRQTIQTTSEQRCRIKYEKGNGFNVYIESELIKRNLWEFAAQREVINLMTSNQCYWPKSPDKLEYSTSER